MKNPKDVRISKPIERTAAPPLIGSPICGSRRPKTRIYGIEKVISEKVGVLV